MGTKEVAYLGFKTPRDIKELQRFLGCTNYYRRFIPNYANITKPLYDLLKKNGLSTIKTAIPDLNRPFILDTDASHNAIAGILQQEDEKVGLQVVAYASRTLRPNESRWHIGELEALAIVWTVEHFRDFLWTAPQVTVNTDHQNLKWIWSLTSNRRITRQKNKYM